MADSTAVAEVWHVISSFPRYEVSSIGRVRRVTGGQGAQVGRILTAQVNSNGYMRVPLRDGGRAIYALRNRLVCTAFNGPPPTPAHHAAHIDGNRTNDVPENLYWATVGENAVDRVHHGTQSRGNDHGQSKLTEADARAIRASRAAGVLCEILAQRYGVRDSTISRVATGRRWAHIR